MCRECDARDSTRQHRRCIGGSAVGLPSHGAVVNSSRPDGEAEGAQSESSEAHIESEVLS
jgi:hypothetical protein